MELLHTIAGVWTSSGGPAASVSNLCRGLSGRGHRVTLLTGRGRLAPEVRGAAESVSIETVSLGPYALANVSPSFHRACRRELARCRLVHTHGLWLFPNWSSASAARGTGKPLVISPRGMLEPWAIARSRWRKKLSWTLFDKRSCDQAALVHAVSRPEGENIRRVGVEAPIAVIPNGVDLGGEFSRRHLSSLGASGGDGSDELTVLFLSRIHPKKGLDLLLAAWSDLAQTFPNARLLLCGPGEAHEVAALQRKLEERPGQRAEYRGRVEGDPKLRLLKDAAVVVLPSLSENYGMVIAEALACGTPVITTTETPWEAVSAHRCGWQVRPAVDEIHRALTEALRLSVAERAEMGQRGRALIEAEHSAERAAEKMEAAYLWALGEGQRPDWVFERELS